MKIFVKLLRIIDYFYIKYILYYYGYIRYNKIIDKIINSQFNFKNNVENSHPSLYYKNKNDYYQLMIGRYIYAGLKSKNKNVFDFGCGYGWGTYILSQTANKVIGIDMDSFSINYAEKNYKTNNNILFKCCSIYDIKNYDNVDLICMFEVIEHFSEIETINILTFLYNKLKNNGQVIMSSYFPDNETKNLGNNKHHKKIYTKKNIYDICYKIGIIKIKFIGSFICVLKK